MKPIREIHKNEIHLWSFSLCDSKLLSATGSVLSSDEKERSAHFVFDRDRERFGIGRVKLRKLLAEYTGIPGAEIIFRYNTFGKPVIEGNITFNISHSEDIMVAAVAKCREVGIDVEKIKELNDPEGMARVAFTEEEKASFCSKPEELKKWHFLRLWTRKEALLKAMGIGFASQSNQAGITREGTSEEFSVNTRTICCDGCYWRICDIEIEDSGYYAALCYKNLTDREPNPVIVNFIKKKPHFR
jgi:Phosphopantetheinyl transferase